MAVKYKCPKCERKYIDWGAEKLGFKCPDPDCENEGLVKLGSRAEPAKPKPTLKRKAKKKAPEAKPRPDISTEKDLIGDINVSEDDEDFGSTDEDFDGDDDGEKVPDVLDFAESGSPSKDPLPETGDTDTRWKD